MRVERPSDNAVLNTIATFSVLKWGGGCPPPIHSSGLYCTAVPGAVVTWEELWLLASAYSNSPPTLSVRLHSSNSPPAGTSSDRLRFPRKSEASAVAAALALTSPHRNYLFRGLMPQWREWCLIRLCNQPRPTPSTSQTPNNRFGNGSNSLILLMRRLYAEPQRESADQQAAHNYNPPLPSQGSVQCRATHLPTTQRRKPHVLTEHLLHTVCAWQRGMHPP